MREMAVERVRKFAPRSSRTGYWDSPYLAIYGAFSNRFQVSFKAPLSTTAT
jgi:hypothetical protein